MEPTAIGSHTPSTLLRAFERPEYAEQFIRGNVRFGRLDSYRQIKDCRRDEKEGDASLRWSLENPVYCQRSSMNPRYILCTSHPDIDKNSIEKFGAYVVRIQNPKALFGANRIHLAATSVSSGYPQCGRACRL